MIDVYITCKDHQEARTIANRLVELRLIACATMFPIESCFRWNGTITNEQEIALLCKTRKENFARIESEVKQLHSYKTPCIIAFEISYSSRDFAKWVEEETETEM